ncbi:MAG TPA: thiamine pyrophosphate-dependent dehydrogenase E1 component subunit alpha [Chloroflexota bacterium]|nr:thiamine pyrophosphate-dependent dehydrogenase E1 component subunit alpha [Chloroflexota bacterium]
MSSVEAPSVSTLADHEAAGLTAADLKQIYYYMQLTRSVEDRVRRLYLQGSLQGAVYSSRGQEGTAVASAYALEPQDFVAPLIRDLGASFTRGLAPAVIFCQWLGRAGGPTGGRDGNLHFGDLSRGVLAPISMLGATIPLCAGIALAAKQRHERRVALAYIGDGGTNTGEFHEGLNFAAALRLPVVVIVEDNGYAYSTPTSSHVAIRSFAQRAEAYGIPSATVDGNNVIDVYRATRAAVDRARAGGGASLIEAKTFRMRGHAEHDDASYVPNDLFATWEQRDPIRLLVSYLVEMGLIGEEERAEIDRRIEREVDEGLATALESPLPAPETQTRGVYAD